MTNVLVTAAEKLGRRHGSERGSWVIDGNTTRELAQKIIDGYEKGDPEVMDLCQSPLKSEYDDDPSEMIILEEIGELAVELSPGEVQIVNGDNLLDIYDVHFQEGFWETVIQAARHVL